MSEMAVAVDARVDLMAALIGLTRWGTAAFSDFDNAVKRDLRAALAGCPHTRRALALLEGAARFRFDAPHCWMLHHGPLPDLAPLAVPPRYCLEAWNHPAEGLDALAEVVRAVGRNAAVAAALRRSADAQAATVARAAEWIAAAEPVGWLTDALGPSPLRPAAVLAACVDWHGYGASVEAPVPTAYAVLGGKGIEHDGRPVYGSERDVPAVVLHELAHGVLNPAAEAFWGGLPKSGVAARALAAAYPHLPGDFAEAAVQGLSFAYTVERWGADALRLGEFKRPPNVDRLHGCWMELLRQRPITPLTAIRALTDAVAGR